MNLRERFLHWLLGNTKPSDRWIIRKAGDIYRICDRLASVEGRIHSAENSAAAANSRAERLETRLRAVEGRLALMDATPPPFPREGVFHE